MIKSVISCAVAVAVAVATLVAQGRGAAGAGTTAAVATTVLRPARVFDGEQMHDGWVVIVRGQRIDAAGPASAVITPAGATTIDLPGMTVMPGLIEAHSHVLLHPYNETPW